jgi:hypothetical protein
MMLLEWRNCIPAKMIAAMANIPSIGFKNLS